MKKKIIRNLSKKKITKFLLLSGFIFFLLKGLVWLIIFFIAGFSLLNWNLSNRLIDMSEELNQSNNEFKVFGLTMEKFSIFYGFFLIFWGVIISFISGSDSLTSYIPSFLGIPILIFSYLSIKFITKKKCLCILLFFLV